MDREIRKILVCPKCKGTLSGDGPFTCTACRLKYPLLNCSTPNLLVEEAEAL